MTTRTLRSLAGGFAILLGSLSSVGCDDGYSGFVQYTLRTDPLALSDKFGEEQREPDRPGIFPIMSMKDLLDPLNPMYPKRDFIAHNVLRDPNLVPNEDRQTMLVTLESWFGTPRRPKVKDAPASLGLEDEKLAEGSALYRVHCLHCHGITGDGRGVTAKWINPHPRDFRQGLFKFQSVDQTSGPMPPRREDLRRTLVQGVEGTAMPAFNLLDEKKIDALVSYVIHLSIRGKTEFDTIASGYDYNRENNSLEYAPEDEDLPDFMKKLMDATMKKWVRSQKEPIKIQPYPYPEGVDNKEFEASVQRGYAYFLGDESKAPKAKSLNCVSCHVDFGRQSMWKWDAWGTLVRPNNLTNGVYRGGRKATDLYYRIHSGINGSNMPAFGVNEKTPETKNAVWDLVNFVQVLPYPAMRQKLGIKIDP